MGLRASIYEVPIQTDLSGVEAVQFRSRAIWHTAILPTSVLSVKSFKNED